MTNDNLETKVGKDENKAVHPPSNWGLPFVEGFIDFVKSVKESPIQTAVGVGALCAMPAGLGLLAYDFYLAAVHNYQMGYRGGTATSIAIAGYLLCKVWNLERKIEAQNQDNDKKYQKK